jgi:hypothetical protein
MHMLLFDIVPLHNDALLVSFNELLHPFEREAFRVLTKPRLHRLLDVTMRAEPLHVLTSSLIKASTVWMCWSVLMSMGDQVDFHPLHLFFPPQSVLSTRWCMVRAPYSANIRRWISEDLTPSAHRKCTMARCSSMVQSLSRATLLLPSLLSAM